MRCARVDGVSLAAAASMAAALLGRAPIARGQTGPDGVAVEAIVHHGDAQAAQRPLAVDPAADALAEAKRAVERATRLQSAGDEARAKAADSLAREWAETARDIARAVTEEARADELRRRAFDAQERVERVRALIEEEIAHVGRLRTQLDEAVRAAKGERRAIEVHDDRGAPKNAPNEPKPQSATEKAPKSVDSGALP